MHVGSVDFGMNLVLSKNSWPIIFVTDMFKKQKLLSNVRDICQKITKLRSKVDMTSMCYKTYLCN